jgi:hypothetical protein
MIVNLRFSEFDWKFRNLGGPRQRVLIPSMGQTRHTASPFGFQPLPGKM